MAGIDSYTKLLLHCEGADASTTFTDSSSNNYTSTAVGTGQIDTAQFKFGSASGLFSAGNYVHFPSSTDWECSGDFTIDLWVRFTTVNNTTCFVGRGTSGTSYLYFGRDSSKLRFRDYNSGENINITAPWTPTTGQWYHVAVVRYSGAIKLYVDGVALTLDAGTVGHGNTFLTRTVPLQIGQNSAISYATIGWLDEVRWTKGFARWTTNFTPPTAPYDTSSPPGLDTNTKVMLKCDGTNGSTTFTDVSASNRGNATVNGSAQVSTALQKFGTGSAQLTSAGSSSLAYANSTDWDFGTSDFTIDLWVRRNGSQSDNASLFSTNKNGITTGGTILGFGSAAFSSTNKIEVKRTSGGSTSVDLTAPAVLTDTTWIHIALVRFGKTLTIYQNGVGVASNTAVTSFSYNSGGNGVIFGRFYTDAGAYFNGNIDEIRVTKGVACWTENFPEPTAEYQTPDITVFPSNAAITSTIQPPVISLSETATPNEITITSSVQEPYYVGEITIVTPTHITSTANVQEAEVLIDSTVIPNTVSISALVQDPDLIINSQFDVDKVDIVSSVEDPYYVGPLEIQLAPGLSVTSSVEPVDIRVDKTVYPDAITITSSLFGTIEAIEAFVRNASRIISYNPLIIIDNSDPLQIGVIDTTDPVNPTINIYVLASIPVTGGYDVFVDEVDGYFYIACNSGEVAKVQISNPSNFTVYDVNDVDNLTSILYNSKDSLIHTATLSSPAEVYTIDNRLASLLRTDLRCNADTVRYINTNFMYQEGKLLNTNFVTLTNNRPTLRTSLVVLTEDYNALSPIGREDFDIRIDGISLDARDLDLSSIEITHNVGERSKAIFKLAREHDDINRDYNGNTRVITNQNLVEIYIDGHLEFTGRTAEVNSTYGQNADNVEVIAWSDAEPTNFTFDTITMPLPGLDEKRHLYHIITEAPRIYNPYLNPDDANPDKYRGIRVPAGKYRKDIMYRWKLFANVGSVSSIYFNDLDFGFANPKPVSADFTVTNAFGEDEVIRLDSGVAYELQNGLFTPVPGWQYFWFAAYAFVNTTIESATSSTVIRTVNGRTTQTTTDFETGEVTEKVLFNGGSDKWSDALHSPMLYYIGTGISNGKTNLWTLAKATYWRQRGDDPIQYHLGDGSVSVQNFEDEFVGRGQEMFDVCVANGYLLPDGTITAKFKNCIDIYKPIIDDSIDMEEYREKKFNIGYGQTFTNKAYSLIESFLGYYRGSAPFKNISISNGVYIPAERFEDREDGLYRVREEAYDYRQYGMKVADLEYQKMLNINGDVLPITSLNATTTIDAYYFYNLRLLNRINISNTTTQDIFNRNNGFPTAIKGITISSDSMTVTLNTDNEQSEEELDALDSQYPMSDDYVQLAYAKLQYKKYDVNTGEAIKRRDGVT